MKNSPKFDRKFEREFNRAGVRSMFASIFATVVTARKREGGFTFAQLANRLGVGKAVVSRWFNRDVNWELNTIADIAAALEIDIRVTAVDRQTGRLFGPSGQFPTAVRTFSNQSQIAGDTPLAAPATTEKAPHSGVIAA